MAHSKESCDGLYSKVQEYTINCQAYDEPIDNNFVRILQLLDEDHDGKWVIPIILHSFCMNNIYFFRIVILMDELAVEDNPDEVVAHVSPQTKERVTCRKRSKWRS